MSKDLPPIDLDRILSSLKDFQRATVDYVFRRFYEDGADCAKRFLIADEAGLGKTLVARGIIAKTIAHLARTVDRIDIVYICSNADIARQNVNRLSVCEGEDFTLASRITLLPLRVKGLRDRRLNFISLTPRTSFELHSNLGTAEERALLYWFLEEWLSGTRAGLKSLLQGNARRESFRDRVEAMRSDHNIDAGLQTAFLQALTTHDEKARAEGMPDLQSRLVELCGRFARAREALPQEERKARTALVGELRSLLAASCLNALEPDLIILDEFQRFKHLLDDTDEESLLAQGLFDYSDAHRKARVLLLSATPYKMYTLNDEAGGEDHYKDFLSTLRFLLGDGAEYMALQGTLDKYRDALFRLSREGGLALAAARDDLERSLRRVMVRTEKLSATPDRGGMLVAVPPANVVVTAGDLNAYLGLQRVARELDCPDTLEQWKSAPYLLNFMDDSYALKGRLKESMDDVDAREATARAIVGQEESLLPWGRVRRYEGLDPANARLRNLVDETMESGIWRQLWLPPSLPYYEMGDDFRSRGPRSPTKRLVFSSWVVVPKAVACVLSYEVERRMITALDADAENSAEARAARTPLLRFARDADRLTGMPLLALLYPCTTLAVECDPLRIWDEMGNRASVPAMERVVAEVEGRIGRLLHELDDSTIESGPEDEAWYWAAPILLDLKRDHRTISNWFLADRWERHDAPGETADVGSRWADHVARVKDELIRKRIELGRRPRDLVATLARIALAGPGTSALRALSRTTGGLSAQPRPELMTAAGQVAWALLHLFNVPEVTALLRAGPNESEAYWKRVLQYSVDGGLQSVLDEYAHVLLEMEGLRGRPPESIARGISEAMAEAISLRTVNLGVDELFVDGPSGRLRIEPRRMRGRFAIRFGEYSADNEGAGTRAKAVREAFNSPFWPFVLASTSVGQEGLDFHAYCHAVVHWNLPANPVDLEQREGRVHRYKGHAVRKNVAAMHGLAALSTRAGDPWEGMFAAAVRARPPESDDLVPFWVYSFEGGACIERHVPAVPLSRDVEKLAALRRSLAVYRMVFGQSRQEDCVEYLLGTVSAEEMARVSQELTLDLRPPKPSRLTT
ncbi:MAG: helicase-related protein [bacterium]